MAARYASLAELQAAYASAPLDPLVIDNDDTHVYSGDECVFRMHPAQVLEEALDLLGIPHEEA